VRLPFLDRELEIRRIDAALDGADEALVVLYGRRRLGKSRIILEVLKRRGAVYYVGDERDAALQRASLAREIEAIIPGFGAVEYPEWEALLGRWWREAPAEAVLALDELPALVGASPELPSVLQKLVDQGGRKLIVCGSSQRMMEGLVLDGSAPLYGRAKQIMRIDPLPIGWLGRALGTRSAPAIVDHHAAWGGVPRYWELAREHRDRRDAITSIVLDPLGVLHREPERLLLDDLRDIARAASILALIGRGCHRISEIGARLAVPATSLSRPLERLIALGYVQREVPFGRSLRDTKRTYYRLADPFLRLWFRFVEPNRSRLAAGQIAEVAQEMERAWPQFLGNAWQEIASESVARLDIGGRRWRPAARWWGHGSDGKLLEIDILASSLGDPDEILAGEVKLSCTAAESRQVLALLERKVACCPPLAGKRVRCHVWTMRARRGSEQVTTAAQVIAAQK